MSYDSGTKKRKTVNLQKLVDHDDLKDLTDLCHVFQGKEFYLFVGLCIVVTNWIQGGLFTRYTPPSHKRGTKRGIKAHHPVAALPPLSLDGGLDRKSGPSNNKVLISGRPKGMDVKDVVMRLARQMGLDLNVLDLAHPERRNDVFRVVAYITSNSEQSGYVFRLWSILNRLKDVRGHSARTVRSKIASKISTIRARGTSPEATAEKEEDLKTYMDGAQCWTWWCGRLLTRGWEWDFLGWERSYKKDHRYYRWRCGCSTLLPGRKKREGPFAMVMKVGKQP